MRTLVLSALLLSLAACGSEKPVEPRYSDIQRRVFSVSCSFDSCHGDTSNGREGNLVLTPEKALSNLINVDADDPEARARGKKRVVPGQPLQSFLYHKLDHSPTLLLPDEGDPMPDVGERLPQQKIDAIRTWIERGAPND